LEGYVCEPFSAPLTYLQLLNENQSHFPGPCCVLCDVKMPDLDGLELQRHLAALDDTPLLLMSGASGAHEAASAFRAGALDFLIKPIDADLLLTAIAKALSLSAERQQRSARQIILTTRLSSLTEREREIARRVVAGQTNQTIADDLGIALRTVKRHRQIALEKVGAGGTAELVRIAAEGGL
jgi:FixJ family two-component response regulator